jgi:site-specific recombinase XerD
MRSFDRSLNRSELTRDQYLMSEGQLVDFFAAHRMTDTPTRVNRAHVEAFLADFATSHAPATVQTRYKCLNLFFAFLKEEGAIRRDPMQSMKPLAVPEVPVAVLSLEELDALLKTARGRDFVSRRDEAIMRLFIDTGMRPGELAALTVDNIDFEQDAACVISKESRPRAFPFGAKTGQALGRYLRERAKHPSADLPWVRLGKRGRLSDSGILTKTWWRWVRPNEHRRFVAGNQRFAGEAGVPSAETWLAT